MTSTYTTQIFVQWNTYKSSHNFEDASGSVTSIWINHDYSGFNYFMKNLKITIHRSGSEKLRRHCFVFQLFKYPECNAASPDRTNDVNKTPKMYGVTLKSTNDNFWCTRSTFHLSLSACLWLTHSLCIHNAAVAHIHTFSLSSSWLYDPLQRFQ